MINYPNFDALLQNTDNSLELIRSTVKNFVDQEIEPIAQEIDQQNNFPSSLWQKLGNMGLLGITVNSHLGGSNLGYLEHIIAMEEISRGSASVGLSYAAHSNLCVNQIYKWGNSNQQTKYLPKLISGEAIGALAMSEANAGSDVLSMQLAASQTTNGFILNGSKMWVTNGTEANIIIVYAKTNNDKLTAFIITDDLLGFKKTEKLDKFGMRGSNTCELIFNNCKVPLENILGPENQGTKVLMSGLNYERLILAAGPIGIMQACIDLATSYANTRKQFGKRLGELQLIQDKLANCYTYLNASRAYLYSLAKIADQQNSIANKDAASVFLFTAQHATKIALDTMQILGGNGYCNEYAAGRLLRDAKLYEIGGGTNEIRKLIIAKEILQDYANSYN